MTRALWYWIERGERQGPLGTEELRRRLLDGSLAWTTSVWRPGMPEWQEAVELDDLAPRPASPPTPPPSAEAGEADLAAPGRRIAAKALDLLFLIAALDLMTRIAAPVLPDPDDDAHAQVLTTLIMAVYWLYYTVLEGGGRRASIGKRVLNLEVVDSDGQGLTFGPAAMRALVQLLTVGWLLALFDPQRRCLHDRMAGSLVVNRPRRRAGDPG